MGKRNDKRGVKYTLVDFNWFKVVPKDHQNRWISERNDLLSARKFVQRLETPEAQERGLEFLNWLEAEYGEKK